jgi:hypothetical protein
MLPAILLVGGSLNGLMVRVLEAWQKQGLDAIFLGISPFELITMAVAAVLLWAPDERGDSLQPGAVEVFSAAALLVPSSLVSWAVVGVYASILAWRTSSHTRLGAILFAGIAACSLWSSLVIKWIALPLTTGEAWVVAGLLSLLSEHIVQSGNIISAGDGHSIVLMTACSSLDGLPRTLLAVVAVALAARGSISRHLTPALAAVAVLYIGANLLRLLMIAWSAASFGIAHGPIGTNVFDATMTLVVLAAGLGASRP